MLGDASTSSLTVTQKRLREGHPEVRTLADLLDFRVGSRSVLSGQ